MKLTTKINLILISTFSLGLALAGGYSYQLTQDNALRQVTDQAELIMLEALAMRNYTVNEIRPLLNKLDDGEFHPQTVPAYSATQTANLVRKSRPDYTYKEAVFNPTNPRNKANRAEEEIINQFIADPYLKKLVGSHVVNSVKSLYISYPIKISNPKCLVCHSEPEFAPKAMLGIYGDKGGFGWKLNEIIGTQVVTVPFTLPDQLARDTFYSVLISLGSLFLALFIVINVTINKLVIRPVIALTEMSDQMSKGNLRDKEILVRGKDEIAEMARSFNRMRRSIIKIVQMMRKMKTKESP